MVELRFEGEFQWITLKSPSGNMAIEICFDSQERNFRIRDTYGCFYLYQPEIFLNEVIEEIRRENQYPHGETNWIVVKNKILKELQNKLLKSRLDKKR